MLCDSGMVLRSKKAMNGMKSSKSKESITEIMQGKVDKMTWKGKGELFKRCEKNPILTADDWPYQVNSVL